MNNLLKNNDFSKGNLLFVPSKVLQVYQDKLIGLFNKKLILWENMTNIME